MKTTTTTREYDADGNLVREVVVEQDTPQHVNIACTCPWLPHTTGYCPVHGYRMSLPYTVTCSNVSPAIWPQSVNATVKLSKNELNRLARRS